MPLDIKPLSDRFGVAITNVDLSKDLEIIDVFVKKQVLVFRDQHIEPQHQVAFSRRFGPLEMLYDEDQRVPGFPEIAILSNEKVDGKFIGVVATRGKLARLPSADHRPYGRPPSVLQRSLLKELLRHPQPQ